MFCDNCKNNFLEPLQGRNNARYCPVCLMPVSAGGVRCNAENMAAYTQSELMFSKKDYKRAIELCTSAALQENPYACINMGFYYENGYIPSVSNEARILSAFEWYDTVARYNEAYRSISANGAAPSNLSEKFDVNLVDTAIKNILCLFLNNSKDKSQFVLDKAFKSSRSSTLNTLASIAKVNLKSDTIELSSENLNRSAAFYASFPAELIAGFRKVESELLTEITREDFKSECAELLNRYYIWIYNSNGKLFSAGNYANLFAIANDTVENKESFVTLAFFKRDAKKVVYKSVYEGGKVSVKIKLNVNAFKEKFPQAVNAKTFGDSVNLFKNDFIIAKKNDLKDILSLCI